MDGSYLIAAGLVAAFAGFCWLMWRLIKHQWPESDTFNRAVDTILKHEAVKAAVRKAKRRAMGLKLPGEEEES